MADSADDLNKSRADTAQRNGRDRNVASPHGAALSPSVISRRRFMARQDRDFEADETGSEQDQDDRQDRQSNRLAGAEPDLVPEAPAKGKGKQKKVLKDTEPEEPEEPEQPERSTLTVREQLSNIPLLSPFGLMVSLPLSRQDKGVRSSGFGVLRTPPAGYEKQGPQTQSEPPN